MSDFVVSYVSDDLSVMTEHRGGVAWWDAPIPRRLHWCKAQTNGFINYFTFVERCACGAIRISPHGWKGRNSRRETVSA